MRIHQLTEFNQINVSFSHNQDVQWTSFSDDVDTFESNEHRMTTKQEKKTQFELSTDTLKKNLWLSKGMFTKRHLKAFLSDPKAYLYEFISPAAGRMIGDEIIGQTKLKNRKTKERLR